MFILYPVTSLKGFIGSNSFLGEHSGSLRVKIDLSHSSVYKHTVQEAAVKFHSSLLTCHLHEFCIYSEINWLCHCTQEAPVVWSGQELLAAGFSMRAGCSAWIKQLSTLSLRWQFYVVPLRRKMELMDWEETAWFLVFTSLCGKIDLL